MNESATIGPAAALEAPGARRRLGLIVIGLSTVAWSTAGFFSRLIPLDAWTILFWRSVFGAATALLLISLLDRRGITRAFRAMTWPALLFSLVSTLGMVAFLNALKLTTVAHVSIIYATVPFIAAALAFIALRERATGSTLVASALGIGGVSLMVAGRGGEGTWLGDLLAFAMTALSALMIVIGRAYPAVPMVPAACLSALMSAIVSFPFAAPFDARQVDLVNLALFGTTNMGLGLILFVLGSRFIPAAQTALIGALEAPLAVLWVWLAFNETPKATTIIGGATVFCAVIGHLLVERRPSAARERAPRDEARF